MGVDSGWPVDAEQLASRLRFKPEFGQKVADESTGNNRGYYESACSAETEI